MKLILAADGSFEYDIGDELFDLEVEIALLRLLGGTSVNDNDVVQALRESAWEEGMRAYG